jgi:hypothetical protein
MRARLATAWLLAVALAAAAGHAVAKPKARSQARGPLVDTYMPIGPCVEQLPPPVDALLKPVLLALAKERRAMRLNDPAYARQVQALLRSQHARALEAQVAALAYYLGDREGEWVLAHVLAQGKPADELVAKYRACRPVTSFEDKLGNVQASSIKYMLFDEERRNQNRAAQRPRR